MFRSVPKTSQGSRCTGNSVLKLPRDIRPQLTHSSLHALRQNGQVTLESGTMPTGAILSDSLKEKLAT